MMLRLLQRHGHRPMVLMGGGTTRIGDPSGKDETRQLLTDEQIAANMAGIRRCFERFLRFGDGPTDAIMANNADWLSGLDYIPFLREVGTHFSINRMLTFDSRAAPAGPRAAADLPRIQLHDPAGLRLPGAEPPLRRACCRSAARTSGATSSAASS